MNHIKAVFRRGVFEPLEPVDFEEEQRVQLNIETDGVGAPQSWQSGSGDAGKSSPAERGGAR
jgi:predicted DNA-binding antitoxin AbrB/MazE fold protein